MNRLKDLRLEKGLNQSEIGAIAGVHQTAIGKYERGELEPNISTLRIFADFFGCSIDYLVGRSDDFGSVTISPVGAEQLTNEERALLEDFRQLDAKGRMHVTAYCTVRLEELKESRRA